MVIFGYSKEKLTDLQQELRVLRSDIETLQAQLKSLKGYVYQKKVHLPDPEEQKTEDLQQNLNNSFIKTFLP